jgi:hypothetical protein
VTKAADTEGEGRPALLTWRGLAAGLAACVAAVGWVVETVVRGGGEGLGNDFYIYWASARVLASGGNPYHPRAVDHVLHAVGLHVTVGQDGYSYPLLFAVAMLPLAHIPAPVAAAIFAALSVAALLLTVALLASPMSRLRLWELLCLGLLAGSFIPIRGSLFFGQANLLLLLPLALAFRGAATPVALAAATAVKLYPGVGLAALLTAGLRAVPAAAFGMALAAALIVIPNLLAGQATAGHLFRMLGPDTYWTNESLNGAVSRLALRSDWTAPLIPGLPVTPIVVSASLLSGILVAIVLIRARGLPWSGCLSLALGWALLAAPKVSLWDLGPLMVVSAYLWPQIRRRPLRLMVLGLGWLLIAAQSSIDASRDVIYQGSGVRSLLSSLAVVGALLLVALTARVVWAERQRAQLS